MRMALGWEKKKENAHLEKLGVVERIISNVSLKIRPQNVDWIHVCRDENQQQELMNKIMKLQVP